MEDRGRADLALASDRLASQLQGFRELAVLMADHPALLPLALGGRADPAAGRLLQKTADRSGAWRLDLLDGSGALLASLLGRRAGAGAA